MSQIAANTVRTAAYWLDKAIKLENEGRNALAESALKKAIITDNDEHTPNSGLEHSLPRN